MANTAVTIAKSKVTILAQPQAAQTGFTHVFHVDYTDVNVGAGSTDTVTMTLGNTPANFVVDAAMVNIVTAFANTGGFTIQVGSSGSTAIFIAATSVLSGSILASSSGPNVVNTPASAFGTSTIALTAVFTNSTSGSPSALNAGSLDIYLRIKDVSKLSASTTG
jgi:hypothetical protein